MDFVSAFLGVLAIVGIIVVGGFVIFFLGDLVLSVLDPSYTRFGKGNKKVKENENKEYERQLDGPKQNTKEIEYNMYNLEPKREILEAKAPVIEQGINEDFFKNVKKEEPKENLFDDPLKMEEENFKANMLKSIEERRAATKNEVKPKNDEEIDFEKFFFDDEDIDVFSDNDSIKSDVPIAGQEEIEDLMSEDFSNDIDDENNLEEENVADIEIDNEETETSNEKVEVLRDEYEAIIARLENEKLAIKQANENLEKDKSEAQAEIARLFEEKLNISKSLEEVTSKKEKPKSCLSIDEYELQLSKLKDRLLESDKDLRRIKKDFIPLRKVHKTLENDEKKLRRREATVAKQKVELYGVNNIADIDKEKAKKLTEDLDLLEGLKLSVKHCEEVMIANKDRYPILEKTYDILLKDNKELKEDIAEIEEKIAKLKAEN